MFIAYGIGRSDAQSSVEELPESDESGAELKPGNDLES